MRKIVTLLLNNSMDRHSRMADQTSSPYKLSDKVKRTSIVTHLVVAELIAFVRYTLLRKARVAPQQHLPDILDESSRQVFQDELQHLEQLRLKMNRNAWVLRKVALPAVLVYVVVCLLVFPLGQLLNFWILALPVTLLGLSSRVIQESYLDDFNEFNDRFRHAFIPALAKSFGDIQYQQHGYIELDRFKSRLPQGATSFDSVLAISRVEQEDYFSGTHRGCHWELVYATLYNHKHKSTFKGLILLLELPRAFEGTTVINMRNPVSGASRVHLEKGEFSDQFVVSSTDQISARSWLTPAVMERLYQLRQLFNGMKGNLTGSSLLLLLDTPTFLPLPPIDVPLSGAKPCLHFVAELKTLYELIDTLLAQFTDLPAHDLPEKIVAKD